MRNKTGFTLAEVLTTLMVIGVVAALTIPNLVNSYKKRVFVTNMKKSYSELSQAMKMIPVEKGCTAGDFECTGIKMLNSPHRYISDELFEELRKQLKGSESNTQMGTFGIEHYFKTPDGKIYYQDLNQIRVDTNGEKGPNIWGYDKGSFWITTEEQNNYGIGVVIPRGSKEYSMYHRGDTIGDWEYGVGPQPCNKNYPDRASCTGRVIETGVIDF